MIQHLQKLDKSLMNKVRFSIVSHLMNGNFISFNELKGLTGETDGNLATHIKTLEQDSVLHVTKQFVGNKPMTTYSITTTGKIRFMSQVNALYHIGENFRESANK